MSVGRFIIEVSKEMRNEMRIKLTPTESRQNPCAICSRPADFLAVMKVAGNKFLCNRCVK